MNKMMLFFLIAVCCILFSACNGKESKTETTTPTTHLTASESTTAASTTQSITNTTTQVQKSTAFNEQETQTQSVEQTEYTEETTALQMTIGDNPVSVDWEDNEAVEALKDICRNQPLTIQTSMYGGFEQVGSIGTDLPRNDVQITTSAGDIVLYSGNQMVVFYDSNSWAYTRLGHITDQSIDGMTNLLSNGDTVITISLE